MFSFFNECTQIINSPSCCVLNAWNTLSKFVSLTWNFQISFVNSLHLFLNFSDSMSVCFFGYCWIKPSQIIETKIYVKNGFKAANTAFLSSKVWYNFLTMKLSNKAMKNESVNKHRNNINIWVSRENSRKTFCSCLLKKMPNEKKEIVNKNVLNKSKDISFALFCFVFNLHLYLHICECWFLESYIQC